jgi:hypothetical protein
MFLQRKTLYLKKAHKHMISKRILFFMVTAILGLTSCRNEDYSWLRMSIDRASHQLLMTAEKISDTGKLPRSTVSGYDIEMLSHQLGKDQESLKKSLKAAPSAEKIGTMNLCGIYDWTSGFFPGALWYAYEMTGDENLKEAAVHFTNILHPVSEYKRTHDVGFMINCSYGNALRLSPNDSIPAVIIMTAESLCSRFDENIGCIRSWDFGRWNFPVIIDNMMNLELLFAASRLSGNPYYKEVALSHADKTLANHFRSDASSWHVVSYNDDGTVEKKQTHQGRSDDSAWARGQAWGLYGYTVTYRETGDKKYLKTAVRIADMIMDRVKTDDAVPYWDFDAPADKSTFTPRDASAAAITASAMLELSTMTKGGKRYFRYAEKILKSLSSEAYLAAQGENEGFILMHSTGVLPQGAEIDVPLIYADYYYLEGLKRYLALSQSQ